MFFSEAIASDTLRLSFWNRFWKAEESRATEAEAEEEEDEEAAEEEVELLSGRHSDLSSVRINTCSTMSSSVLARLDQHSRAAAMVACGRERERKG